MTLPMAVDIEKVEAMHENGVLTLRLPKSETVKPKKIALGDLALGGWRLWSATLWHHCWACGDQNQCAVYLVAHPSPGKHTPFPGKGMAVGVCPLSGRLAVSPSRRSHHRLFLPAG